MCSRLFSDVDQRPFGAKGVGDTQLPQHRSRSGLSQLRARQVSGLLGFRISVNPPRKYLMDEIQTFRAIFQVLKLPLNLG